MGIERQRLNLPVLWPIDSISAPASSPIASNRLAVGSFFSLAIARLPLRRPLAPPTT